MGKDKSKYEIIDTEAKDVLSTAVSDVGYWQWWDEAEGDFMVEFGGVLLYDETKKGKQPRSSTIAISFWGNSFLVFLDNNEDSSDWIDYLHKDMIDSFTLDPDGFIFDDKEYALDIMMRFNKRHGPFSSKDEAKETIMNSKSILAATCGDYGFIIGGDVCKVYGASGDISEEDIKRLSKKWWDYWKDYYDKRDTEEAYEKDYACEVTIPVKN